LSALDPTLNGIETHPKMTGYRALGLTTTDRGDHRTAFLFQPIFCTMKASL